MDDQFKQYLPSFLFAGALAAIGCSVDTEELDAEELEALEAEAQDEHDAEADALDELVDPPDEARSGGGGGGGGGGNCGGGGCCGGGGGAGCCPNDHEPPKITCEDVVLWPPNHKYREIDLDDCITSVDECDPNWSAKIIKVTSDEPEDGQGDGNTMDDIQCVDDDTVELRAERSGNGDGRVYTITFEAKDTKNNKKKYTCKVIVPHDQGNGNWAGDSGVQYTEHC